MQGLKVHSAIRLPHDPATLLEIKPVESEAATPYFFVAQCPTALAGQSFAGQLSCPKLARASISSSKLGMSLSKCNVLNTSSTWPPGCNNFRSPPWAHSKACILTIKVTQ